MLPQQHIKDPGYSDKYAQVTLTHACTLHPTKSEWAGYTTVQAYCGKLSGKELTRNSSANTRPESSQLAESLWTDPGLIDLICTLKKKEEEEEKSAGKELIVEHSPNNLTCEGKATTTTTA